MMSMRSLRVLDVCSALVLLAAAALYVWPVHASIPEAIAPANAVRSSEPQLRSFDDGDASVVVAANVLSASRRAPSVRYVSPELESSPSYPLPSAFTPSTDTATAAAADGEDAVPALYGIVNLDGISRALLRLAESDASPVLLREGDRRGSYRVVSIREREVIVAGPNGQRTLRLPKVSRSDSTGKSK